MDSNQRSKTHFNFWITVLYKLCGFCLFYLGLVRPIQTIIVRDVIGPAIQSTLPDKSDIVVLVSQDDYWIESRSDKFVNIFLNLPFNGYFWLASFLIWNFKKWKVFKFVFNYNLVLFIIHPIFIMILFNKIYWIAPIINAHEIVYKALFISMGIIALKEGIKHPNDIELMIR